MELIIFIGIPASGKSTFYMQNFFHTHVRVNLDMLKTRNRESKLLDYCFETKQRAVIDNTNVKWEDREQYILQAKNDHFKVIGYFFKADVNKCIERNSARTGKQKIGLVGIYSKAKQLELPSYREGFDEIFFVRLIENEFRVSKYHERSL